jgi:hypothetical protein
MDAAAIPDVCAVAGSDETPLFADRIPPGAPFLADGSRTVIASSFSDGVG